MSKKSKLRRQTVELRPSRIRRDPVRLAPEREVKPVSPEREKWNGVAGVVTFAVAGAALIVGISEITSHRSAAAADSGPRFGHCYNHGGPSCVLDGDTIRIEGETVEIAGMDAPEIRAAGCREEARRGIEAAVRLVALLNSGEVTIAGAEREADGQPLRKIEVDGRDVGAAMVSAGVARAYGAGKNAWC